MKPDGWQVFLHIFHSEAEGVFRYHLISCGDWRRAEAQTAESFHAALACFNFQSPYTSQMVEGLWRMVRVIGSRRSIRAGLEAPYLDSQVDQALMSRYACCAQVTAEWMQLQPQEARALGLYYFGGLGIDQIARVIHADSDHLSRIILEFGSASLTSLAAELHPAENFITSLESELAEKSQKKKGHFLERVSWMLNRFLDRACFSREWMTRLAVLMVIAFLVAAAWSANFRGVFLSREENPIHPTVLIPVSSNPIPTIHEDLVVVNAIGQIWLLSLDESRHSTALSGPQFFPLNFPAVASNLPMTISPGFRPQSYSEAQYSAQISPNGKWLSLVRPIEQDSWIISMDGSGTGAKISDFEVKVTWAPDSHAVAFINPHDPRNLVVYEIGKEEPTSCLQHQKLQWLSLAWSPDSKWVGAIFRREGNNQDNETRVDFARIEALTMKWEILGEGMFLLDNQLDKIELIFSEEGKKLWLVTAGLGVDTESGKAVYLAHEPSISTPGSGLVDHSGSWFISPDGQNITMVDGDKKNNPSCTLTWYHRVSGHGFTHTGCIDGLTWTSDSSSLIIQQRNAFGPTLLQIDAQTGTSQVIGENLILLGLREQMQARSWKTAKTGRITFYPGVPDRKSQVVSQPGGSLQVKIPMSWSVWVFGDGKPSGALFASNFSLSNANGYAQIPAGRFMLSVQENTIPDILPWEIKQDHIISDGSMNWHEIVLAGGIRGYQQETYQPGGLICPQVGFTAGGKFFLIRVFPGLRPGADEEKFDRILKEISLREK